MSVGDEGVRVRRCEAGERGVAMSLLLGGGRGGSRSWAQDPQAPDDTPFGPNRWWIAQREGAAAAALVTPCAGRTAMLFTTPVDGPQRRPLVRQLARTIGRELADAGVMAQALLDPAADDTASALLDAGFLDLATLAYLRRRTPPPDALDVPMPPPFADVRLVPWDERRRPLFERGILGSYRDTRDCPALVGLRTIDDILAGHRASGRFVPELWHVLLRGPGDDAAAEVGGVMLINLLPERESAELVYLGIVPPWRGGGLARALLARALGWLRQRGVLSLMLAVDEANEPARRLYRSLGFEDIARKRALIHVPRVTGG